MVEKQETDQAIQKKGQLVSSCKPERYELDRRLKRTTVFNCLEIFEIDDYHLSAVTVFSNQNKVHISDRSEVDDHISRLSCVILQTVTSSRGVTTSR